MVQRVVEAFALGFFPPESFYIGAKLLFEVLFVAGIAGMSLPPLLLMYMMTKRSAVKIS